MTWYISRTPREETPKAIFFKIGILVFGTKVIAVVDFCRYRLTGFGVARLRTGPASGFSLLGFITLLTLHA